MDEFYISRNEEIFNIGPYPSREKAILEAPYELESVLEKGATFWVGKAVDPISVVRARTLIDALDDYATDNAPDGVDGFEISKEAEAELDELLRAWASKHKIHPRWYSIVSITEHEMP
jgi:hypothetical protein